MECESGYRVDAVNYGDAKITGMNSWGLFMHNERPFEGWNDALVSTQKAWNKFSRRNWVPWKNCAKELGLM